MKKRNRERIGFINPSDMPHIQVVCGTNVTNEFPRHVHQKFCLGIVHKRARVISQAGNSAVIPENAVFAVNAGMAHTCKSQCEDGHDYLAICVDMERMRDIASQIADKAQAFPYVKSLLLVDEELASKIYEFFFLLQHAGSVLQRESLLISMLSRLIMRHGDSPPILRQVSSRRSAIDRVCEFIRAHFAESLSLAELSTVAGLSPFHFQRLFLKNTGVSPHEYLIQSRVRKARNLLLESRCIAGVAIDTGFVDQSHFTRSFKRIIGITPGRFVELHR